MFKLVISDDEGKTIIVPLVRDLITIGRQEGNTIRLTERNVSRQHARLVKLDDGYRLEDLDAYNGVKVNGERIRGSRDLVDGDKIVIGDYALALHSESDVATSTTRRHSKKPSQAAPPPPPSSSSLQPARLVMVSAPAPGAEFSITKDAVRVGRLEELDLCISHRSISREHAEIRREGGTYSVQDLESANGVRVNGSLTKRGALKSGDLLDLGQVRFRFVGEGEPYVFDADEVHSVSDAPPDSGGGRSRMVLVVGLAVLGAGAFAWFSEGGEQSPTSPVQAEPLAASVDVEETGPNGLNDDEAAAREQVTAAGEGCRKAVSGGLYEEALRSAQNGLMLAENDSELRDCRDEAQRLLTEQETFEQAMGAYDEGDVDAAYLLLAGLPQESPFARDPRVDEVFEAYGNAQLGQARAALGRDPDLAARLAAEVVALSRISDPLRAEARALRRKTESAEPFPRAARERRRERPKKRRPTQERATNEGADPDGMALAESPAKLARSCLARGDQKCAVRALEGRTRNAQELALLVETYRALGDTKRAVRSMQQFVKRYPSAPQAGGYRTFIERNSP